MLVFLTNFLEPFVWSKLFSCISCLQETLVLLRILIRSDIISFYYNNVILVCNVVQTFFFYLYLRVSTQYMLNEIQKKWHFGKSFGKFLTPCISYYLFSNCVQFHAHVSACFPVWQVHMNFHGKTPKL